MAEVIFEGPDQFVDLGKAALELCDDRWPQLLNADLGLTYVDQIPDAPRWAVGLWRGGSRQGFVRKHFRRDGRPKAGLTMYLTIHEGLSHPSDQDKMSGRRGHARRLMEPFPTGWRDTDGLTGMAEYWHLPFECYANRMVEALTRGAVRSPYDDDYTRWIPDRDLDELLAIPLGGTDFVGLAVDPDAVGDTLPENITEPTPDPRLVEAIELLGSARQLFKQGVEVTARLRELREA